MNGSASHQRHWHNCPAILTATSSEYIAAKWLNLGAWPSYNIKPHTQKLWTTMTAATILLLLPFSHSHTGSGGESLTRSAPDSSRGVLGRMIFGCRATTCDKSGHMLGTAILCALCSTLSSATLCGLLFRYLPPAISWHGVTPISKGWGLSRPIGTSLYG